MSSIKPHSKMIEAELPPEEDDASTREKLIQETLAHLRSPSNPMDKLKLIDVLHRLGIAYHFENDIKAFLEGSQNGEHDEDLETTSLRFRLLRHNGFNIATDVFRKFLDTNGEFSDFVIDDVFGLLSLYEASYLGGNGEEILSKANLFTKFHLTRSLPLLTPENSRLVSQALELPRNRRMSRLEARKYVQEYGQDIHHNFVILKLAKLDYNMVQSQHKRELADLKRWWKQLGLIDKLRFARDRPLECFLWTVGILPEPKYSGPRIELAKTIALLLVIDDVYDSYGTMGDLILFTNAIQRWDLNAIEELPGYMKICYMALINTTNEISYMILKEHGHNALPFLKSAWIYAIEGFMTEVKWSSKGGVPNLEEYLETRVSTAGAYMALVHLSFLIGKGVTNQNDVQFLLKPYPKLFSCAGRILRLWDDLGTAKEEKERGEVSTSIQLYMKENAKGFDYDDDDETTEHILLLINESWKELNGELISVTNILPREIIEASFNMARASQVVYQHQEISYIFNVDNYVQALFFTQI